MKRNGAARLSPDFDLATGNCAVAQNADPMIVQGMPFPPGVIGLEDCEFLFGKEGLKHEGRIKSENRGTRKSARSLTRA
jgi:hypothetical protein